MAKQEGRGFEDLDFYRDLCHRALQALNGYINFTRRQRYGYQEFGDRAFQEPAIEYTLHPTLESTNTER